MDYDEYQEMEDCRAREYQEAWMEYESEPNRTIREEENNERQRLKIKQGKNGFFTK